MIPDVATSLTRPGGELAHRPLLFYWIVDCSGSMGQSGKIQALNTAVRETLPHLRKVASDNPNARLLVQGVRFATGAERLYPEPKPLEGFLWRDLAAGGLTDLGAALDLVLADLDVPALTARGLPPVLVLVSDGQPTDDFEPRLAALLAHPWGARAVRMAIAVGHDADREVLDRFIATPGVAPLQANGPEALVRQLRWISTVGLRGASAPVSRGVAGPGAGILPVTPEGSADPYLPDVW